MQLIHFVHKYIKLLFRLLKQKQLLANELSLGVTV